jgi:hypothetical protein
LGFSAADDVVRLRLEGGLDDETGGSQDTPLRLVDFCDRVLVAIVACYLYKHKNDIDVTAMNRDQDRLMDRRSQQWIVN